MTRRLKVLVSVYACSPVRGSEPGMGWGFVRAVSQHHDLWVITEKEKFESEIESELETRPQIRERVKFLYVRKERHRLLRKIWPLSYYWFYQEWQERAFALGAQLHRHVRFDLVHQLNLVGFREPGYLWKLDVPFVWGPIGGLENTPWHFLPMLGAKGSVYYGARNVINLLHKKFLPGPKRAFRKAAAVIAATEGIRREIRCWYGRESEVICEIGLPPLAASTPSVRGPREPLRLAWSGLHIPRKALPLLLHALAQLGPQVPWALDILGEGPQTLKWRRTAERLGLDGRCRWHGWLPREEAVAIVQRSHVFVITSLYDLTSTVLVEALSQGVPVICPDHYGFADVVDEGCGIKIPVRTHAQFESDLAQAISALAGDEERRRRLAAGALRRAQDFTWEKKARAVCEIYESCVS